jgi:23S rRNA (adenine2503-C2)-methyltransferase
LTKWIYDCSYEELGRDLGDLGFHAFVKDQVFQWLYGKNNQDIESWTNISKSNREVLARHYDVALNEVKRIETDSGGTRKLLIELKDRLAIEAVLIPEKHHYTFCISSQVGCGLGCAFCATGTMGFRRNLSSGEILCQVLALKKQIPGYKGKINLVFMGMGEPLLNYENLGAALNIITANGGLAVSPRNITVSTAGILEKIRQLEQDFPKLKLSFSLNASGPEQRAALMPISRKESLTEIMDYFKHNRRKHRLTFEYVLIKGINDSLADARKLAALLEGSRGKINLIPYNENECFDFQTPAPAQVDEFGEYLSSRDFTVMVRWSRGGEIKSACGQLVTGQSIIR